LIIKINLLALFSGSRCSSHGFANTSSLLCD